jgi:serine/threonine protein kinase/tetratricopeptide (TPR) repeat protein
MTEGDPSSHGRAASSRYTLLEKLGAGGQAEVWRARDEKNGAQVALKVLGPSLAHDEAAWQMLAREHSIASKLNYPSILKVYPPHREGDFVALPMELAPGGDLRRLRGSGYLEIVPVIIDIAQALEYAHDQGVIHRDLKPSNVLFDGRGRVRIADFGIAGTSGEVSRGVARPGLSPFTASPEQLRGDPPSVADDIYGLGALAYELLSGYPPYYPRFEVKRALDEPVPELKPAHQAPHQLVNTIMRMLAMRAAMRPRTMSVVIDEFDAALNDTLTFDYDQEAEEPTDGASPSMRRDAAVLAAAEAAKRAAMAQTSRPAVSEPPPVRYSEAARRQEPPPPPAVRYSETTPGQEPVRYSEAARRQEPPDAPDESVTVTGAMPKQPPARTITVESFAPSPPPPIPRAEPRVERRAEPHVIEDEPHEDVDVPLRPDAGTIEEGRIAAAAAAVRDAAPHLGSTNSAPTYWDDVRLRAERTPKYPLRPQRPPRRSWPWVLLTTLVAGAVVAFVVLPKYGGLEGLTKPNKTSSTVLASTPPAADTPATADPEWRDNAPAAPVPSTTRPGPASASTGPSTTAASSTPPTRSASASTPAADKEADADTAEKVARARATFEQRLAALEARGAGVWGGAEFASAKWRAAEAQGANDAGAPQLAAKRLNEALRLLAVVEARANQSLSAQLTEGEAALAAGQGEVAKQAFESAVRIDPNNQRALNGLQRVRNLGGVLPLLADGENAESEKDYARAVQDYSQALSLDPNNARARAGLDRAHAAFGNDTYAKAVGAGFAALGAGRLDDARESFEKARDMRPNGTEAQTGLARVGAALRARGFATTRQRASGLEAEERWSEAAAEYEAALKVDPSLVFAQQGRARALARSDLSERLQALIDRPDRLASQAVRAEADTLIKRAAGQDPSGPVLRSQIQRLQILLPTFDTPVRIEMVSDNATQVQIQRVGTFGTFNKREIELKPGRYTVVGTRPGFRDVRRDVTIAPGDSVQTISVSCVEPI